MAKRKKKRSSLAIYVLAFLALLCALIVAALVLTGKTSVDSTLHPVRLNEIMAANRSYPNADGRTPDWIELYNTADYAIDISGYRLTDNNRKIRYTVPTGASIEPDGYYVIWCEKNQKGDYADFAIDKAGGEALLLLSSRNVIVDSVTTDALKTDESFARGADGTWRVMDFGTPGFPNTEAGYSAYLQAHRDGLAALQISEIQSGNVGFPDENGMLYDWIELYNAGTGDLDISGYRISDKRTSPGYTFPTGTVVPAGGYFVLYCNRDAAEGDYARFSLSSSGGETLMLWNPANMVLDEVETIALDANSSMIYSADGGWIAMAAPSPGFENTEAGHAACLSSRRADAADLRITEVMPANNGTLPDGDGEFSDWIEITNCDSAVVSLAGWSLADRADEAKRWELPDMTLAAGERLIVFASGKDRRDAAEPHTDFLLSRLGESACLFSPQGMLISSLSWSDIESDQSVCTDEESGEIYLTSRPTPGLPNTEKSSESFMAAFSPGGPLIINEIMSGNGTLLQQSDGGYYDWVELRNISGESVELSDFYLSDDSDNRLMSRLPAGKLAPDGLIVFLCSDETVIEKSAYAQMGFSLSATSDSLFLSMSDGTLIDHATLGKLPLDGSYGRMNGQDGYFYFASPTPGGDNAGGFRQMSAAPAVLTPAGIYNNEVSVELSGAGEMHYTLDGSMPTADAALYTGPIRIAQSAVMRAVCVEPDKLVSHVTTASYLIGVSHDLPVVSLTTDQENITGDNGLLNSNNRYDRTVERFAHIEYFEGDKSFSMDCGIKLHGGVARERSLGAKHSYKVVFRTRYSGTPLEFPLFEDTKITTFYSLLLRNGEDSPNAVVRDELVANIARRETEGLLVMNSRYCALYLNGQYWGLYAIKESLSPGFYATHYDVTRESVDLHRDQIEESEDFLALKSFVKQNDMTVEENYRYVADRIDLVGMADWCVYEAYSANSDIGVNVRYYRSTEDDGKWRYALYDMDDGMKREATFHYVLTGISNLLPRKLLKNAEFQDLFLTRLAYHLQKGLSTASVLQELDTLTNSIRSEMPRERERWPVAGKRTWEDHIDALKAEIELDRAAELKQDIAAYLRIPLSDVEAYFIKEVAA